MKRTVLVASILLLAVILLTGPAGAFTAKTLDIAVQENADAVITFDYELSWVENIAVFMRIADPARELQAALESNYNRPVTVLSTDAGRAQMLATGFASRSEKDGAVTYRTPALSFTRAEKILNGYWFAPFISPDFSPEVTRVAFPDGYAETFSDQISIPAVSHTAGP